MMARSNDSVRRVRALLIAVALNVATGALAMDTGIRTPPKSPPDVVNCGDPATSKTCFECETGGTWACCRDPLNCVVVDTTSGAAYVHDYVVVATPPVKMKSAWGSSSTMYAR